MARMSVGFTIGFVLQAFRLPVRPQSLYAGCLKPNRHAQRFLQYLHSISFDVWSVQAADGK